MNFFTPKNTRYCFNSTLINFEKAYFAAGCFWGVEHYFETTKGVKDAVSGYMGGDILNPTYEQVCTGETGHLEVVEVTYDKNILSYESLVKIFFEIHNFEQTDGQGFDRGSQYLSAIFYTRQEEKEIIQNLFSQLVAKGYTLATQYRRKEEFYKAEDYHQDYYQRKNQEPYCHTHNKKLFSNS